MIQYVYEKNAENMDDFFKTCDYQKKKELEEKKNIAFKSYQNIFLVKAQKIISFKINKEN